MASLELRANHFKLVHPPPGEGGETPSCAHCSEQELSVQAKVLLCWGGGGVARDRVLLCISGQL